MKHTRFIKQIDKLVEDNHYIRKNKKLTYYSDFFTFDIETTNIKKLKQAVTYLWSVTINNRVYYGRTLEEFKSWLNYANDHLQHTLVCYVHNLSYEFMFLAGVIDFGNKNVFLLDRRKALKITYKKIEFRCSYLLTNMNLAKFTKEMNVKNKKLPNYNYNKYRFPWSRLTWLDYRYNGNDTLGLYQALQEFIYNRNEDDIASIPMTSTGFIRRDLKHIIKECMDDRLLEKLQPNPELLLALREAFRGGNTHHNRYFYGEIVKNVHSYDYKSHYPSQMENELFPLTQFQNIGHKDIDTIERKIKNGFALLIRVAIWNIQQIDPLDGCPYIPYSKCRRVQNHVLDNGRILEADYIEITITDLDYKIIKDTYKWDFIVIMDAWQSHYKPLPAPIRTYLLDLFEIKETMRSDPYLYGKAKNKFNSAYGVTVQNPLKRQYEWNTDHYEDKHIYIDQVYEDLCKKKFLPYSVGVWVTTWARFWLHEAYKEILKASKLDPNVFFLYCDTDSLKFAGEVDFTEFNQKRIAKAEASGAYIFNKDNEKVYIGVLEYEDTYKEFVSLGAKKYCYRDQKNKLHLTLSGVSKSGVKELKNKIENFKEGFIFKKSAGLSATFNDDIHKVVRYQKHDLLITPNIYLAPTTYKLNLHEDYKFTIDYAKEHKEEFLYEFTKLIEKRKN